MTEPISRSELVTWLNGPDPPVLVEALGADYHADAHLPGAVNIPPGRVEGSARRLVPDLSTPVVVYGSRSGDSEGMVARRLEALGYERVWVYEGGKEDWVEHGLPVHRAPAGD